MKGDVDAAIETFVKNDQVKKVFRTMFILMAGLVPAHIVGPGDSSADNKYKCGNRGVK
jgi:hypothetical protein